MKHTPAMLLLCLLMVGRPEHTIRPLMRPTGALPAAEAPVPHAGHAFECAGARMLLKPASLEQGGVRIDSAAFTEHYIVERHRTEQVFRVPAPVGSGALVVRIPVESNVTAAVTTTPHAGWGETEHPAVV